MAEEANVTMMNIESTLETLLGKLVEVAKAEAVDLPSGPPEAVAYAYLLGKVPNVFNITVPAQSAVLVKVPFSGPSEKRGIALASAIGLLVGHSRCEAQLAARHAALAASAVAAEPVRLLAAAAREASACLPTEEFHEISRLADELRQRIEALLAAKQESVSTKARAGREEALTYNVMRDLAQAFTLDEIVDLVDDGQGGDRRRRRARYAPRLTALQQWPKGYSEGFLVGTLGDADSSAQSG